MMMRMMNVNVSVCGLNKAKAHAIRLTHFEKCELSALWLNKVEGQKQKSLSKTASVEVNQFPRLGAYDYNIT